CAPASIVFTIPICAVTFGDARASRKFGSGTLICSTALPAGLRVIAKVTDSDSVENPPVLIFSPAGAAGWVEMRSWLTSVNAEIEARPWPAGVEIGSEET